MFEALLPDGLLKGPSTLPPFFSHKLMIGVILGIALLWTGFWVRTRSTQSQTLNRTLARIGTMILAFTPILTSVLCFNFCGGNLFVMFAIELVVSGLLGAALLTAITWTVDPWNEKSFGSRELLFLSLPSLLFLAGFVTLVFWWMGCSGEPRLNI